MLSTKSKQLTTTLRRARFASMLWTVAFGTGIAAVSLMSDSAYGQGPACGCETVTCESCAPSCDGPTCRKPRKLSFAEKFLKQADKLGDSIESKMRASSKKKPCNCGKGPSCGAEQAPTCGCEHPSSPTCGVEFPPTCGCEPQLPTCGCEMTAPGCGVENTSRSMPSHSVHSNSPFVRQETVRGDAGSRIHVSNDAPPIPKLYTNTPNGHTIGKIGDVPSRTPPTASSPSDPSRRHTGIAPSLPAAKPVQASPHVAPTLPGSEESSSRNQPTIDSQGATDSNGATVNESNQSFTPRFPNNGRQDPPTLREIEESGSVVPPRIPSTNGPYPTTALPVAPLPSAPKRLDSATVPGGLPGIEPSSEQEIPDVLVDPFKDDARNKSRREKMNGIQLIHNESEAEPVRIAPGRSPSKPVLRPVPVRDVPEERFDESGSIQIGATSNESNQVVPINHIEIVPVKVVNPPRRIIDSSDGMPPKVNRIPVPKSKVR